ncbi:LLM class F420-dependent oxidoreductase [Candidatus Bathyarchaeota archaeon]|nr:LLM class F420-dependent oxidoreductase [Candidatus Bathyarchaeota archaeon]
MELGIQIPRFDWPGSPENIGRKLVEIAQTADKVGFSSLWFMDHFFQIGSGHGPVDAPMLEGYTALSYMAAVTRNVKLGLMVTGAFYRYPGILVKQITTLDVLSGGRAILGIGAGWNERESKGLGVPFPPLGVRFEMLEETLQIAEHMWRDNRAPFKGKHFQLEEPICSPQPISKPHPFILIGGGGEKKTLRLVAKYGDACNLLLGTPLKEFTQWQRDLFANRRERIIRKLSILRTHCEKVGRSYEDIEPTTLGPVRIGADGMTSDDVIKICCELAEIGIRQCIFNMPNSHEITPIEAIGEEVIPQIRDL